MRVRILNDSIAVDLTVLERIFALSRSFSIPFSKILKVSSDMPAADWREIRMPGTYLPGVAKYGSYYIGKTRSFWLVRKGRNIINIEAKDMPYNRYVLEVENNDELISKLRS